MTAKRCITICVWTACVAAMMVPSAATATEAKAPSPDAMLANVTQGALRIYTADGNVVECPLKHTDVKADISGFLARVRVTQTFLNPTDEKIEAVYVFPLPHTAAVDEMTMVLGERRIVGVIQRRDEARRIYEEALLRGATAALLEQERPNIFTQSVGNIAPKQEIRIEIGYVDTLAYDLGVYEFHFPMVVGPRYIPGGATSKIPAVPAELVGKVGEVDRQKVAEGPAAPAGAGTSPDTDRVPDASRITPPVLKPDYRNGHDISLSVRLDAGVPIFNLEVPNHKAAVEQTGKTNAVAVLSAADSIPNKDFVLRYKVVGEKPELAVLGHRPAGEDGYFLLMVQPKEDEKLKQQPPREMVFLIDVSGSMSGQPTEKVKQAMAGMLKLCREKDTVQVVTFASQARKLFEKPLPVTEYSISQALNFTRGIRGGGGTEMLKGVQMAIDDPLDAKRVRIVVMLTDGYIGNEAEIIEAVGKGCGDQIRFWCIGIGSSVNRFLVDGVAKQGGGMGKVLGLQDDASALTQEVMLRIQRAQLANVSIDYAGLGAYETYPAQVPELWAGRPVVVFGRYAKGGKATIKLSGRVEGEPAEWSFDVDLPPEQADHAVLAKVWARNKIEDLMQSTYYAGSPAVEERVTGIALKYRLMSQYTSFVAVDESTLGERPADARPPRRMLVPVPIPDGTRFEGFFGGQQAAEESEDQALWRKQNEVLQKEWTLRSDVVRDSRKSMVDVLESEIPWYDLVRYPDNWREITASRGKSGASANARGRGIERRRQIAGQGQGQGYMVGGKPGGRMPARSSGPMPGGAPAPVLGLQLKRDMTVADGVVLNGSWAGDAMWCCDGDVAEATEGVAPDGRGAGLARLRRLEDALKRADALKAEGLAAEGAAKLAKLQAAENAYAEAYLFATAASIVRADIHGLDANALAGIEAVRAALVSQWTHDTPGLGKKLDLILRGCALDEAVGLVARVGGFEATLADGSLADAHRATGLKHVDITYLDLRGATAAEALDWITRPLRLTWRMAGGKAVVGPARRLDGRSAWVYDVSVEAIPLVEELQDANTDAARLARLKELSMQFLSAARMTVLGDANDVQWFTPGELLVVGDAAAHARLGKWLTQLADPNAKIEGPAAEPHKAVALRVSRRGEALARVEALREAVREASLLNEHAWRMLAAASEQTVDLESLTELQVAWSRPAIAGEWAKELPMDLYAARAAWAVRFAATAVPKDAELSALADQAAARCSALLAGDPNQDGGRFFGMVYALLAGAGDDNARATATAKVLAVAERHLGPAGEAILGALLARPARDGLSALATAAAQSASGHPDMTVLLALACRKTGGQAWDAFRAHSRDILGQQPLPGSLVVFVQNLANPHLKIAAR